MAHDVKAVISESRREDNDLRQTIPECWDASRAPTLSTSGGGIYPNAPMDDRSAPPGAPMILMDGMPNSSATSI